jgi:segregation and condensation protein A
MAATLAEIKSRMLLPRAVDPLAGIEEDPRAELVRRLQEYERFKRAAENLDAVPRLERDVFQGSADFSDRRVVKLMPQVTLREMLLAFKDVAIRSEMFAHHHVQRERLSVRARMTDILTNVTRDTFVDFLQLFRPEEGRMGVAVTFIAILELVREGLIEVVQNEPYAPLHVRAGKPAVEAGQEPEEEAFEPMPSIEAIDGEFLEDDDDDDVVEEIDPTDDAGDDAMPDNDSTRTDE